MSATPEEQRMTRLAEFYSATEDEIERALRQVNATIDDWAEELDVPLRSLFDALGMEVVSGGVLLSLRDQREGTQSGDAFASIVFARLLEYALELSATNPTADPASL